MTVSRWSMFRPPQGRVSGSIACALALALPLHAAWSADTSPAQQLQRWNGLAGARSADRDAFAPPLAAVVLRVLPRQPAVSAGKHANTGKAIDPGRRSARRP
jgi:hypothetical protein